jgi:hypothetical protein
MRPKADEHEARAVDALNLTVLDVVNVREPEVGDLIRQKLVNALLDRLLKLARADDEELAIAPEDQQRAQSPKTSSHLVHHTISCSGRD